jgi:sterol desaturase/sphingolipid hydroxylase (fatty acid hydroxylase superfamily)
MQDTLSSLGYLDLVLALFVITAALTLLGLAMGYAAEASMKTKGRTIFAVPRKRGLLRTEIIGTVLFHFVYVPPAAYLISTGWLRFDSESWLALALSASFPWLAFQIFYYFFHRALHSRALFFMHRWHHESLVTSPMTGLSMSPLEALGWLVGLLGPPLLLSSLGLLHFWGYAFFLSYFWIGNIAGHANADFFPPRISRRAALFVVPITYHALHHARFDGHYSFAAAYMDRLLGTEFADWKPLHDRVYDGTALTSLRVKGDVKGEPTPSSATEA